MSRFSEKFKFLKLREALSRLTRQTREASAPETSETQKIESMVTTRLINDSIPACLSFLSLPDLLKWSENISKSAATAFDKAMDKNYLERRIGGGNHRMFDMGHDLPGAWEAAKNARPEDAFQHEVLGFASGLWKDLTTVKGLPFITWDPDSYEKYANWVASSVPGASLEWFYDLMSYDALELGQQVSAPLQLYFVCLKRTESACGK